MKPLDLSGLSSFVVDLLSTSIIMITLGISSLLLISSITPVL